ncbi:cell division protein ZapA [Candidatus Babeliales bacterium]|nr:cell division protein ZapA [Candidatus Babeliales bacterium]
MSNQRKLTVSVLGKNYSLITDENEAVIDQAAQLLDSMMQRTISSATPSPEVLKKTTFVALQLAVDLIKRRQELDDFTSKTKALNGLLSDFEVRV